MSKTEREKMLAGEPYRSSDPELTQLRRRALELCRRFNHCEVNERRQVLEELIGRLGERVWIEQTFRCDYGTNIEIGNGTFLNYDCILLDCARVSIGSDVMFGPGVHLYCATHPVDPVERRSGIEMAGPITIGDNAWIGGGTIILPNVEIGENCVIGAGSVVTKSVPAGMVAAGNPCRVIRSV